MKRRFILMLFVISILLVNHVNGANWYVDNAVTTSGNGQSWSSAWKNFANIDWNNIQPGDTVYISGGSTQKVYGDEMHIISYKPYKYTFMIEASGTASQPITITKGKDPGHNGDVIFYNDGSWDGAAIVLVSGNHHVIIDGFKIRNYARGIVFKAGGHSAITNIYIQNNDIEIREQAGIFSDGWNSESRINPIHDIFIRNNTIYSVNYTTGQTDLIYFQYYSNLFIENNILRQLNSYNSDDDPYCSGSAPNPNPHADIIQTHIGANLTVANNYMEIPVERKCSQIFMTDCDLGHETYYGNIIYSVSPGEGDGSKSIIGYHSYCPDGFGQEVRINFLNNVLVADHFQALNPVGRDYVIKNNIFVSMSENTGDYKGIVFLSQPPYDFANLNGNLYFGQNTDVGMFYWEPWANRARTVEEMRTYGAELYGMFADPQFTSLENKVYSLQPTSPAIDAGVSLGSQYSSDKNGVTRPQGAGWDIGAYEYVDDAASCGADSNCDGCVSLGEVSAYVSQWLNGQVTLTQVSSAVSSWLGGC